MSLYREKSGRPRWYGFDGTSSGASMSHTIREWLADYQRLPIIEVPSRCHETPVVSVVVTTYQHAGYIAQCLEAILSQDASFPYEILVGEDESTDGTREICLDYAARNPTRIRLFLQHSGNRIVIGGVATGRFNFACLLSRARGRYVCICEGDDYWRDPGKLRLQVEALEGNLDAVVAFGDSIIVREASESDESKLRAEQRRDYSALELAAGVLLPTQTVMFRNMLGQHVIPAAFFHVLNADAYLFSWLSNFGGAVFVPEIRPSAYRVHGGGIWSQRSQYEQLGFSIETFAAMREMHFDKSSVKRALDETLFTWRGIRLALALKHGDLESVRESLLGLLGFVVSRPVLSIRRLGRTALRALADKRRGAPQ